MSSEAITRNDLTAILNAIIPSPSWTDFFYPVGSYYETSDTTFDPNNSWGGTWALETEGQVHISSGANYAVSGALTDTTDGGSPYIQAHTHSHTNPTVSGSQPIYGSKNGASGSVRYCLTSSVTSDNFARGGTYTVSGGSVNGVSGVTTGNAGNMPPYIIVNRWHRTA